MYDILQLNQMLVPELREIAEKLEMNGYKRLTKKELIYKILDYQAIKGESTKEELIVQKEESSINVVETPVTVKKAVANVVNSGADTNDNLTKKPIEKKPNQSRRRTKITNKKNTQIAEKNNNSDNNPVKENKEDTPKDNINSNHKDNHQKKNNNY